MNLFKFFFIFKEIFSLMYIFDLNEASPKINKMLARIIVNMKDSDLSILSHDKFIHHLFNKWF